MNIREENAKKISEILEMIGPEDASVRTDNDWALSIFYSERTDRTLTIEMCMNTEYMGDPLFDPLMRIELVLDEDGRPVEAIPLYYLSRTLLTDEEIYARDNPSCYDPRLYERSDELDERLSEWLVNIRLQGYLTAGTVIRR